MSIQRQPRPHLLVRASAGSGKTYLLVRRLIGLLADREAPESILAATFSRKAAGEFRSKLLKAIADAVTNPGKADLLAEEVGHEDWGGEEFLGLLSQLVRDPDQLRLSTIDAFFLELVGLFRLELGLGTDVRMGAETADDFLTRDLLRSIFAASSDEVRQAIFHLIEEDRGAESVRSFQNVLEDWIQNAQSLFRSAPQAEYWGALPSEMSLPPVSLEEWNQRLTRFETALKSQKIPPECRSGVEEVLELLGTWDLSPALPKEAEKWIKAGAADREKLLAGKKYFMLNRKRLVLEEEAGEALVELSGIFHANVVHVAVRNTKGAHAFLQMYEQEYVRRRLRAGSIRFADLPHLLSTLETFEGTVLAYRLDARLKHWLLDEFQDTSRSQWQVIHPLVDELFYDAENPRSFFCVGDQKQAIYGWRQGDSRLFDEIYERYRHFEPRALETQSLAKTYRCAPAIVEFTNRLFGSPESFPDAADPAVVERWMKAWTHHESARADLTGEVMVHRAADSNARDSEVVEFLKTETPWKSGRSVAILCRKNTEANRYESMLRAEGIPVVRDGALSICRDFTSGRLLHAIFQVLLHPGDTAALGFLRSNSAHAAIESFCHGPITAGSLRERWEDGSSSTFLAEFEQALEEEGWMDDSERRCLRSVHSLLQGIETSPDPALREMARTIQHARIEDTGAEGSVQILTIHRSKGLEFDMVLLPDLDAKQNSGNFKEFWTHEENGRVIRVLESVKTDVRTAFPPLEEWALSAEQDREFENLCVHYVAFTRAAASLHLFLSEKKGKSKNGIHYWIEKAFAPDVDEGVLVSLGKGLPAAEKTEPTPAPAEPHPPQRKDPPPVLARRLLTPSGGDSEERVSPFLPGRNQSLDLGRRVHAALAAWEWPALSFLPIADDPEVSQIIEDALQVPEIQTILSEPNKSTTVWRERAFDACIEGAWSSGVFDRVHLPEGWKEGVANPMIIDFKTDRTRSEEVPAGYREQMRIYRKALAMILGIEEDRIEAQLIFLRTGQVETV